MFESKARVTAAATEANESDFILKNLLQPSVTQRISYITYISFNVTECGISFSHLYTTDLKRK